MKLHMTTINIGGLSVSHNEEITIGSWGNQEWYVGIWYNLESKFINEYNIWEDRCSLTVGIAQYGVRLLNDLLATNDAWELTSNNCSTLAMKIWNTIGTYYLDAGSPNTPLFLKSSIQSITDYQVNRSVQNNLEVGYMNNGIFVPLS